MPSRLADRRARRVSDAVQQELARLIQFEVKDPRVGMVNITAVEVTSDLSLARVHWSIIGDDSEKVRKETERGLWAARGFLRTKLGVLRLRHLPEITFEYDSSGARAARLNEILSHLGDPPKEG